MARALRRAVESGDPDLAHLGALMFARCVVSCCSQTGPRPPCLLSVRNTRQ